MEQLRRQLEQLDRGGDGEFEWNFRFGPDDFKFKDDFEFKGEFKFDDKELDSKFNEKVEKFREHAKHFNREDFQFDHEFKFDGEALHEKIQEALKEHNIKILPRHLEDIRKDLGPHMEKLHEHLKELQGQDWNMHLEGLEGLENLHVPDLDKLHNELAPMLERLHERMPEMENLNERIDKQLKPRMQQLQERLKVLEVYLEEVRAQLVDDVREVIADEVDADGLSRSEKRELKKAIDELAQRAVNNLGMNIDEGVCTFNASAKQTVSKLNDILDDLADDFDGECINRLEGALKAVAHRLSELEIEIDADLADKIENFEVEVDMDFNFDDLDFRDDDDDDDDEDEDDPWDAREVAAVA
jgi:hypothetical protein